MQRFNSLPPKTVFSDKDQYHFKCPRCSRRHVFTSYKCYQDAVACGHCKKCEYIKNNTGSLTCSRCNITTPYITRDAFKKAKANLKCCSKCKAISDESVKFLREEGKYAKLCSNCRKPQYYVNMNVLRDSIRLGTWCRSCTSKEKAAQLTATCRPQATML